METCREKGIKAYFGNLDQWKHLERGTLDYDAVLREYNQCDDRYSATLDIPGHAAFVAAIQKNQQLRDKAMRAMDSWEGTVYLSISADYRGKIFGRFLAANYSSFFRLQHEYAHAIRELAALERLLFRCSGIRSA